MPLTRQQLRAQAAIARYQAGRNKPPSRKQMQAWLSPIRKAIAEIRTGEMDGFEGGSVIQREFEHQANRKKAEKRTKEVAS